MTKCRSFKYFKTNPENIGLAVMLYLRFRIWLRSIQDQVNERGIELRPEAIWVWWCMAASTR
jgi:putative transposase